MTIDIDKHRELAAHASLRPWGISQGMLVSVDVTGLKLVVADCNYEKGTPNLYFLANIANDHAAMIDEIERLREELRKAVELLQQAAPRFSSYEECMDWQDQGEGCIAKDGHWEHELRMQMDDFIERNKETK